ncbi:hypothetical protein HHK36_023106 [Tetracentron sinense]|uniref:DEAD-box ATP-dependent RNA helicase 50 n=1 Tax=Tetracentron sinense TaxID=13715 RepID=A0A834YQQ6_TETSI|nr:hypothetical protein HHK36_023106 [Tetracentron sinense]
MLAKAPLNFTECLRYTRNIPQTPRMFDAFCSRSVGHGHGRSTLSWPKTRVLIRAGYTRKPMDTPGAYQLIDDDTGEKFIVWGGIDDHSPIPSKEVLSWKPMDKAVSGAEKKKKKTKTSDSNGDGIEAMTAVSNCEDTTTRTRVLAGSFGRLKAQRVRALVRKSSLIKQENAKDDCGKLVIEDTSFDRSESPDSSNLGLETMEKKKNVGMLRHRGSILSETQSQEVLDTKRGAEMIPGTNHSDIIHKHSFKQLSKDQITPSEPHKDEFGTTGPEVSVRRVATNSLRGWSNGEPIQNSRFDSTYPIKKQKKLSADGGFFSRKSFEDLGCSDFMIESLRGQLFIRPSLIQAMAFVPVIEGKSCIIADQSGSGKTLAYLTPVIQRLRQEELQGLGKSLSRSPRVVILVPTAELASQRYGHAEGTSVKTQGRPFPKVTYLEVLKTGIEPTPPARDPRDVIKLDVLKNCRSMSKFGVPFRSMVATGGFRQRTQLENLQQDLDVLIATPGRFIFLLKEGFLQLTKLRCAVLDEVDILFGDEDFEQAFQSLTNYAPVTTQYLFVTATLPVDIYNKLVENFPDCEVIMGPGMHRTSPGLEEILVDCSGDDRTEKTPDTAFLNKKSALLQLAEESPVSKTIVFCNKIETCRKVENVLKRFDRKGLRIRVFPFHGALAQESRLANMKEFLNSQTKEDSLFLICTDRASRGIDFAGVDHVVLFDFPRDPSEYVRRVGRTARGAGGRGKAFVFVVGKQVSLARRIMERNQKGHPLHDVPSAYELMR